MSASRNPGEGGLRLAVGTMSGTSMDGVDVAVVETDGRDALRFGPFATRPYDDTERALLRGAVADAVALSDRGARPGRLAAAERLVTDAHAEAIEKLLGAAGIAARDIDIVGFHGQTVLHRPQDRLTVQIGDGPALARRLGIAVASDFRAADVAAGGEGAPLVPVFHRALAASLAVERPVAVVNLGGVANVTWLDADRDPVAFDTGPANALLDDLVRARTGAPCDRDGAVSARGRIDHAALASLLADPFFARPAPKSLDRDHFRALANRAIADLSTEDAAATLVAFSAAALAVAVGLLPAAPRTVVLAGGGASNPTLVGEITRRLAPARVVTAAEVGWSADAIEAQAFAYLAVRTLDGLPSSFPTTTGVPAPVVGGVISRPA